MPLSSRQRLEIAGNATDQAKDNLCISAMALLRTGETASMRQDTAFNRLYD
jgi:hypothetical protein